jgi:hypothetical protein
MRVEQARDGPSRLDPGSRPWFPSPVAESILAALCALLRFAVCCYRGVHQAVTVDEATTYNEFASGTWLKLFGRYDANNHLLNSILIKVTVGSSHVSPFTLRLPSLLAGLALTLGMFALLRNVESRAFRWSAFALFCLHPLLFDFSIAARGYSLSLAFFAWGLYFAWERRYLVAGVLLGLAVTANITIVFPVLALFVIVLGFERRAFLPLVLPALFIGFSLNYPSLSTARRTDFYIGFSHLRDALVAFVLQSLHAGRHSLIGEGNHSVLIAICGLPLFAILVALASFRTDNRRKLIPFLILSLTFIGLVAANWLFGVNYPAERTCLYFMILGPLSWAIAGDVLKSRFAQAIWILPALVIVAQFGSQLQTRYFQLWRNDVHDNEIARLIQEASAGKPDNSVTVSTTWLQQPSLEFYRQCWHIKALKPVQRLEPTPLEGFDFYVLSLGDFKYAKGSHRSILLVDKAVPIILLAETTNQDKSADQRAKGKTHFPFGEPGQ